VSTLLRIKLPVSLHLAQIASYSLFFIDACIEKHAINCDRTGQNCEYSAGWITRKDRVEFILVAQNQVWASIGFSENNRMVRYNFKIYAKQLHDHL